MNATGQTKRSDLIQPGQSFGKFYLVQTIGEGGTSRIFKGLQQPINRIVALKIPSFSAQDLDHNQGQDRANILTPDEFLSEATLMAKLEHPNIVRIYDFGVSEDRAFISMEYVEGQNLQELIEIQGPLSLSGTLAFALQTLDALIYSHSQEVLHLDLSPANVLVAKSGLVKLLDFGMAGKKQVKSQGKVIGTPAFLSPEHIRGMPGKPQSDLFSFGSLLYFAALGESLFDPGDENAELFGMLKIIESARENPPTSKLNNLAPSLAQAVKLALTGAPASEIAQTLRAAWVNLEGDKTPNQGLLREIQIKAGESFGEEPIPTGEKLRDLYFELRELGRHREAVALLEKALRREPDNALLTELLAMPPAKGKTIPPTMEVSGLVPSNTDSANATDSQKLSSASDGSGSGSGFGSSFGPSSSSDKKRVLPLVLGSLVILLATYLIWDKLSSPKPQAKPSLSLAPSLPSTAEIKPAPQQITKDAKALPKPNHLAQPTKKNLRPRPPALAISGQNGIKVSLNDSVEWQSPSPAGGWIIHPGLISLTLTLPGSERPINSSLYISNDSLYLIEVASDGGFSVARRAR